ncbi:MAG: hypothetical protein NZ744_15885 [Pirellulaceae bacterium]|nr:hypothetical protein [Pirellulaceae bacterium]
MIRQTEEVERNTITPYTKKTHINIYPPHPIKPNQHSIVGSGTRHLTGSQATRARRDPRVWDNATTAHFH